MSSARLFLCIFIACAGVAFVYAALWYAWQTNVGSPDRVGEYRLLCYSCSGLAVSCYAGYIAVLRPRKLLLFLFNSLVILLWFISSLTAGVQMWGKIALVLSSVYLLWRGWCRMRNERRV